MKIAICSKNINDIVIMKYTIENFYIKSELFVYNSLNNLINDYKNGIRYEIIFLDAEINDIKCFTTAKYIINNSTREKPIIILISMYINERYLSNGYGIIWNYIIKPIKEKEVLKLLNSTYEYLSKISILVHTSEENLHIKCKDIIKIEAFNKYIEILTVYNKIKTRTTIEQLNNILPNADFVQPHRSYIINYSFIKNFTDKEIILINDIKIPLSKLRKKEFKKNFENFTINKRY